MLLLAALLIVPLAATAQPDSLSKRPGTEFTDCPDCPVMVIVPKGSFMMGSPASEKGRDDVEGPQRKVTIKYPLAVGKFEVTFAQWDACHVDGACMNPADDEKHGRGDFPVSDVDWFDAHAYVDWLSKKTGLHYRLLSEAEWEYSARAGSREQYSWGREFQRAYGNTGSLECCNGYTDANDPWATTAPVGKFKANKFGLFDTTGNVWEWIEDCWSETPATAPTDGSPRKDGECDYKIMRGGSWASLPVRSRMSFRQAYVPDDRSNTIGFRVARSE